MRIQEVMTAGARTVAPTMPAGDAWEMMKRAGIRHLIVAKGAQVLGVLSDRDVGSRAGAAVQRGRTVAELMTRNVVTVDQEDTVRKAANLMRGRTIGCLPVTRSGKLVGIVTTSDLLELLGRGIDRPQQVQRHALHYRVPHRKQHRTGRAW